ncbi:nucleoside ABC transporter membrane protein [Haloactinospora alba]|uniref:Nucleoside ABC transporter membrane protein n=1 Tax=Haloactinospora alba TaxID=405555 RepID=A0A543NGS4_9ACTN|nr:nucleoside ABC transporter membrane protein [Haloactinospora alba]
MTRVRMAGPVGTLVLALLGACAAAVLDLGLLAPAALALSVAAVAATTPFTTTEGTARDADPPPFRIMAAVLAGLTGVVVGLLTATVADLGLIEPVSYALGAFVGCGAAPLMYRRTATSLALSLAAVALAVVLALAVTSVVLLITGIDPLFAYTEMLDYGSSPDSVVQIVNNGTTLYLSAVAVAIGFKMKLFNIGVDGQYRLAALLAAAVGGAWALPPVLHQFVIVAVAVAVGGFWAGIAGYLKVARGVSEVISTIMLNSIATAVTAYLLSTDRLAVEIGTNNVGTPEIPDSGWVPGIPAGFLGADGEIFGLVLLAAAVGAGYWTVLNRTRFGFDLRATGQSPEAARASGVNVNRMVLTSMVLSGMVAGLVGMPQLLGESHYYALDFPTGLGFTGIAIALLGRNHPVGIAAAAAFWVFLDRSAQILDFQGIPKEMAVVTQATMVLTVVVVYEVVHRWGRRYEQQQVGAELGRAEVTP